MGLMELAAAAGVSVRTVRYYIAEGLLPPPEGGGPRAAYTPDHLDRLRLIGRLKAAYLPLREIRRRLRGLDVRTVHALLHDAGPDPIQQPQQDQDQEPGRASAPGQEPVTALQERDSSATHTIQEDHDSAAAYLARLLPPRPIRTPAPVPAPVAPAAPLPPAAPPWDRVGDWADPPEQEGGRQRSRPSDPTADLTRADLDRGATLAALAALDLPPHAATTDAWHRIPLGPDAELLIRADAYARQQERIDALIAWANRILT